MTPTADLMKLVEELFAEARELEKGDDYSRGAGAARETVALRLQAALTASCDARVGGPDHFDGCDRDGFVGGCERMGCHPSIYRCAEALNLAVCDAAAKGAIDPDHPATDAVVDAGLALSEAMKATPAQPKASTYDDFVRLAKDPNRPKASEPKRAPYGYCPKCGAPGKMRERRPNGYDTCKDGHKYPSRDALIIHSDHPKASEGKAGGEDAARLDWLAHHGIAVRHDQRSNDQGWFLVGFTAVGLGAAADHKRFPTARAAIDAAMTATLTAPGDK